MNRNDCDIARDLMPLSVDGVCAEGSQRFLDEHLAECAPCKNLYTRMKTLPQPSFQSEPSQEAQALKDGLRWLGRRFKALWIALAALACAFVLLLAAAGVQQMRWNWYADVPLDMSTVTIHSTSALVSVTASMPFLEQHYNGQGFEMEMARADENHTGQPEAVILTYTLSYFSNQAKDWLSRSPHMSDHRYTTGLNGYDLCRDGTNIYLIDGMEGVTTADGSHLMLLDMGLPVSEIRIKSGKDTKVVYTWGDEFDIHPDAPAGDGYPYSNIMLRKDYEALQNSQ